MPMSSVIILIGAFIAILGTFLNAAEVVILIGSSISACGAFWAAYEQNKFDKELKLKNDEIIDLNKKIGTISIHTINMVTGGDSFAHIEFSAMNDPEDLRLDNIFLSHIGIYPLYDLQIRIFDVESSKHIKDLKVGNIGSIRHFKHFSLNQSINYDLSGKSTQRFTVFFYSRNGFWHQQIIYKKIQSGWVIATQVIRLNEKNEPDVIFKCISPDFPIPEKDITWQ